MESGPLLSDVRTDPAEVGVDPNRSESAFNEQGASGSGRQSPLTPPSVESNRLLDVFWAVAFLLVVCVVFLIAMVNILQGSICSGNSVINLCDQSFGSVAAISLTALTAPLFGFFWIQLLSKPGFLENAIGLSTCVSVLALCLMGLGASGNNWYQPLLLPILAVVYATFYVFLHRFRLTFVLLSITLKCLAKRIQLCRSIMTVQLTCLILAMLWLIAFSNDPNAFVAWFLLVSLIWTACVAVNIIYATSSALSAAWYFNMPFTTTQTTKRICYTNFGSVCLGSFAISVPQTFRVVSSSPTPGAFLACCVFSLIGYAMKFICRYAFPYVAIGGHNFSKSVAHTKTLFKARAVDVFVNDTFAYLIVFAGSFLGGLFSAFVAMPLCLLLVPHWRSFGVISLAFWIGFAMSFLTLTTVQSMINTFLVLWAENPDILILNHPEQHKELEDAMFWINPRHPPVNV